MRRGISYLLVFGILGCVFFNTRCASTQTGPSGGPKDTIPPVLQRITPPNGQLNFQGKRIYLEFNEYVKLKDAAKEVVISPPSLLKPQVRTHGKGVRVQFNDTLKNNTTYVIDFGLAIQDNNEANQFLPMRYIFSTGSYIDSMQITGRVWDAFTMDPVKGAALMLYHENFTDSTVFKRIPDAYARTDEWGYFFAKNIKTTPYHVVAVEDKNNNIRYDPGSEKIAFLDSLVTPTAMINPKYDTLPPIDMKDTAALLARPFQLRFYVYNEESKKQNLSDYTLLGKREVRLIFAQKNPQINSFHLNAIDSTDYVIESSRFRDTLTFWITAATPPDTIRGTINYMKPDSTGQLAPTDATLRFRKEKGEEEDKKPPKEKEGEEPEKEYLKPAIGSSPHELMDKGIKCYFATLPTHIDTTKIALEKKSQDGKQYEKIPFVWKKDQERNRTYYIQTKWVTATDYRLTLLADAFTDVYGLSNDSTVQQISTPNPDKFSNIILNLKNIEGNYIVQLLSEKKDKVLRENMLAKDGKLSYDYLQAGKYCIRFIEDTNNNGVWDPGVYLQKQKPERVVFFTLSGDTILLDLPANAEIEQTIEVDALFKNFYNL